MIDFEDKIPCHCIRKNVLKLKKKDSNIIEDNVPILIKDLLTINFRDEDYEFGKNLTLFDIHFKTVTIYGNCIQIQCPSTDNKYKFLIDDGSGAILVKYPVKEQAKYEAKLFHLQTEYSNCYENQNVINSDKLKLKASLKRVLNQIDNRIKQVRNIKIGDQVSIVGIPYKIARTAQHYDICIHAEEVNLLTEQNRNKELFFKRHLIYYYTNRFKRKRS